MRRIVLASTRAAGFGLLLGLLAQSAATPAVAQCNAPPAPRAGETVSWSRAGSPYEVCGELLIPEGGRALVEPGVSVHVASDARITVEGVLLAAGTAAEPIQFTAAAIFPPMLTVEGELDLRHGLVTGQVRPGTGGTLSFQDTTFRGNGVLFAPDGWFGWVPPFVRLERCRFEGATATLSAHHCTLVVKDCTFQGSSFHTSYSYPWLDGIVAEGSPGVGVSITHDDQAFFVDGITARGSAGAGIQVGGAQAGCQFLLGPRNVLEGNAFPVQIGDGGLLPGSAVPTTGNLDDRILIEPTAPPRGPMRLPLLASPYLVRNRIELGYGLTIDPGVEMRFGPDAGLHVLGGNLRARGTEDAPIRFGPDVAGQQWAWVGAGAGDSKFEHCAVIGSANGIASPGTIVHVESCLLQDNGWGVQASGFNPIRVRGSRFVNNDIGAITDVLPISPASLDLDGATNPNSFLGNRVAVQGGEGQEDARNNWWGSPSGPRAPTNPSGTGDPIGPEVLYQPFRTAPPDASDSPPFVKIAGASFLAEPGTRQVLRWQASDDGAIVSQRVVLAKAGEYDFDVVIADGLPPDQSELAWTVPEIGYQVTCLPPYLRVIAVDDAGQEGWDQAEISIRSDDWIAEVRVTSALAGTYRPGDRVDICFETDAPAPWSTGLPYAWLFLDGDRWAIPLGGPATSTGCLPLGLTMPFVSTDSARVGVQVAEGCNRFAWGFSECFAIRPDPRVPDAPPVVTLSAPAEGSTFSAGDPVPLRWTASDDEAMRSFDVLASYDGGRTWHEIATELPADATGHDVTLPPGETFADLRLKVIGRDLRFQESGGCGVRVSVVADCLVDADGDGAFACDDCAPSDASAWSPPGENRMLLATAKTTFSWLPPLDPGGTAVLHDALRTRIASNFRDAASCLATGAGATTFIDAELPGLSGPFFYLVRARNACSEVQPGSIGRSSFGVERVGRSCP